MPTGRGPDYVSAVLTRGALAPRAESDVEPIAVATEPGRAAAVYRQPCWSPETPANPRTTHSAWFRRRWERTVALIARLRARRHLRAVAGTARRGPSVLTDHVDLIRHDLLQHVATGLLLSDTTDDPPGDPATRRRLQLLHQQWEDAAQLVARLDPTDDGGAKPAPVDLSGLTRRCVAAWGATRDVELRMDDPECVVLGDDVLIRRAVANLLDNACRASPVDGTVRVRVGAAGPGDGDESYVEVADDGPGFGHVAAGSRLGLQVARAAAVTAGGHLTIQTGLGVETAVRMSFPAAGRVTS